MKCKNTIAMVLAGAMLLPSNAFAADLSQYRDFPNDWSAKSLEQAIDDGLLNGSNGMIDAKGLLTRAQMAAIVSRAFGAAKTASLDDYRDVLPSAWYYSDMGKAVKMGAFQGANGLLNPDAPITREEAFTVLARAFALEGGGSATLKDFVDGGTVSSWASESVAALVAGGYVNGANGMLNLKNNITRAEFAKVITGMAASYVGAEGVSGKTVEGNVIVRESGASLSGMTINGDLIIADSADKVSLDNVKVTGRIVIRGGADAVGIKDTTTGKGVLVSSPNGAAAISVSGGSVGTVTAKSDLSLSGSVSNVAVTDKATLTVEKNASVGTVTVSAAGSKVTGDGKVTNVQANANNVTVTSKGAKVTAGSGVSGVKAGDKTVESGKTGTVGTASSSGGSSSGGSSSSRSDYSYVLMNIPYDEFYKAELENNEVAVDAVSSATKQKTMSSLVGGSYHVNSDGTDITGVIYPVRVKTSDLSGLTQITDSSSVSITTTLKDKTSTTDYTGKDALFQSASHSYYYLSSAPSSYKEATLSGSKWTFGKATGSTKQADGAIATLKIDSDHGDYKIKVENLGLSQDAVVYGVALSAVDSEGKTTSYGLRHLENIWKQTKLAFSTGFVTESHGSPLRSEHYKSIMGKTINKITYFTSDGNYEFATDLYVPVKSADAKVSVEGLTAGAREATLKIEVPSGFSPKVTVPKDMGYDEQTGKITFNSALPGSYEVTVSDAKGIYADVTASFTVSTSTDAAQYDSSSVSLKKADNVEAADFANFLKNITSVKVGDKKYDATGKKAVTIIKKDGAIDEDAKSNNEALFADGKEKTLTVSATGYPDFTFKYTPTYTYAYAAVPYDEYWKSEGVYLSGDNWKASSDEVDRTLTDKEGKVTGYEHDRGAFDAVSRATTNHGLHRGSFQQSVVIHGTKDGEAYDYHPVSWSAEKADKGAVFLDADGHTYNKNEIGMTSYNITGIKYVPVKVKASDFADFCTKYTVTKNGETLQGGYGEENLKSYTAVAAVDKDTNGLKTVTKGRGGYTFGKRQTGTGSGIQGQSQKTADAGIAAAVKEYSGNYGEMLRVDLDNTDSSTKYYGDLGAHMQTVVWKYYGTDESNTTPLATYGTKFAADDWMHKSRGIQLGLTDSLRAKLPDGKDGTGKWTITVYALGYSDTTYTVQVIADNLTKPVEKMTEEQRTKLESLRDQAQKLLDTAADQNNLTSKETELKKHYNEIVELLKKSNANTEEAKELIDEVSGLIKDVEDARKQPTEPDQPTTETKTLTGTISPDDDDDDNIKESYNFSFDVKLQDGTIIEIFNDTTNAGGNDTYWEKATTKGIPKKGVKGLFETLIGKTASDIDSVDAVSGATVSSNAIKTAVKNALSNN